MMGVLHLLEHNLVLAFRALGDPPSDDVGTTASQCESSVLCSMLLSTY